MQNDTRNARHPLGELTQLLYRVLQAQQTMAQVPFILLKPRTVRLKPTRDEAMILGGEEFTPKNDTTPHLEEMEQKDIELKACKNNGAYVLAAEELAYRSVRSTR